MGLLDGGYIGGAGGGGGITTVTSGAITSGSVTPGTLSSGAVGSGIVASGAVQGFFGTTRHIASGTVGSFDLASGAVTAGTIGSGAIVTVNLSSGAVGSGKFASGAVQGSFSQTQNIASGTIGFNDIGSGAIRSGHYGSGQLDYPAFASGAIIPAAEWLVEHRIFITAEMISGAKAVGFNQSGALQIAMASVSGRMPAIGVATFDQVSGALVRVILRGRCFNEVNPYNFSGYPNQPIYVGASGDLVASGAPVGSGNIQQIVGVSVNASGMMVQVGDPLESVLIQSGDVGSGAIFGQAASGQFTIASGSIITYDVGSGLTVPRSQFVTPLVSGTTWSLITEEIISGVRAVNISQSGTLRVAMASVSGRMPAVGVVIDNVLSGIAANVYTQGLIRTTSGLTDYSGFLGRAVWVGRSGQIVTVSGSFNSGGLNLASGGDFVQRAGVAITSGAFLVNLDLNLGQSQLIGVTDVVDAVNRGFGI